MYMLFTFGLKYTVQEKFRSSLNENNMVVDELNTTPTIFNSILWSAIAYNDSVLYTAEYSFWNSEIPINWTPYPRNLDKLKEYDSRSLRTLEWFSDGNYFAVPLENDSIAFFNVKFGRMQYTSDKPEDAFFFYFKFYKENGEIHYKEVRKSNFNFKEALRMLANRIGI